MVMDLDCIGLRSRSSSCCRNICGSTKYHNLAQMIKASIRVNN